MTARAQRQTASLDPAGQAALLEHQPAAQSLQGLAWRFVPRAEQQQVLAVEALLETVGRIPRSVSDPGVALAKLAWWQHELQKLDDNDARHPLALAVLASGAVTWLQPDVRDAYLAAVAAEVDAAAPGSLTELRQRFERTGGGAALLRCAVGEQDDAAGQLRAAGAAVELLDRLSSVTLEPLPAWLPMELVARFGLQRGAPLAPETAPALLKALAEEGLAWLEAGRPLELAQGARLTLHASGRFLLLRLAITQKRLQRIAARPQRARPERPPALAEVLGAWSTARKLYGRSGASG